MTFGDFQALQVPFDKNGNITPLGPIDGTNCHEQLLAMVSQTDDLIVISHGWNNDVPEAQALYDGFFDSVRKAWSAAGLGAADAGRTGVLAIYWPSKRFDEADLISGNAASVEGAGGSIDFQAKIEAQIANLKDASGQFGTAEQQLLDQALAQSQSLDDPAAQNEYVKALVQLFPQPAEPDPGLDVIDSNTAGQNGAGILQEIETQLGGAPVAAPDANAGGAGGSIGEVGTADAGGGSSVGTGTAQSLNIIGDVKRAAWMLLNLTTYYVMKERGGTIGSLAAALVVAALQRNPNLRVHLVGHSFGGRLVTSLANALPSSGGVAAETMMLLQAAYSHYGLAPAPAPGSPNPNRPVGAFRGVVENKKVRRLIQITKSDHDWAIGAAYPVASFIAHQTAAGIPIAVPGTASSPWGGMGANGAQETPEAFLASMLDGNAAYPALPQGKTIRSLNGDAFISGHGSVTGAQVAWAFLQGFVMARNP